jgi:hypothetical protein
MRLPKTQALKDRLRNLDRKGEPFSSSKMGVGQEFVSVVKSVGQENVGVIITERDEHRGSASRRRVE